MDYPVRIDDSMMMTRYVLMCQALCIKRLITTCIDLEWRRDRCVDEVRMPRTVPVRAYVLRARSCRL